MGTYSQMLSGNGTLNFDDTMIFNGSVLIGASALTTEPGNQNGSYAGSAYYDITLTILPVPEPATLTLLALLGATLWPRRR